MPASYLPYEPDQDFLLPPSLREWLDLTAFHARDEKGGPRNQPFHPAMMGQGAAVWVCGGGVQLAQVDRRQAA
jgi:hypothetical protein